MKIKTLHITKPSPSLVEFAMMLRKKSEDKKASLLREKDKYFPKSK